MSAPIDLYYWPTPNGWKISVLLEELGLPYTVHLINIGAGDQHTDAFKAVSPNGKMPAITDPEGPDSTPISIFESGAILQYLARKTGQFYGGSERDRIAVDQWLMWQMGGVGPMAGQAHHFLKYAPQMQPPQVIPYAKARYRKEVARLYGVLDEQLGKHGYVAGDFYSIADMAIYPWASLWEGQQQTLDDKPHMKLWLDDLAARPAVQRGMALHLDKRQALQADKTAIQGMFNGGSKRR
ncbi:glutathione S-transferase family protein [Donghicola mangrovi]|uniref:Glutathione S-transferase family protein n=1 Tax=Donghicola mangrovi TaxID=2729614 RepID=A0A850Q413_9RHOB|nr:glutathione S-transferase family protein [Donghicola mangrovi]NVO23836.1 glutathione S-transferase family protein [Donghicola mangrovi]